MANQETKKVGLNEVNFLELGEEPKSDDEVIIEDDSQQEQPPKETDEVEEEQIEAGETEEPEEGEAAPETDENEDIEDEQEDTPDEPDEAPKGEEEEEFSLFKTKAEELGVDISTEDFEGINFDDPTEKDLSKFIDVVSTKLSEKRLNSLFEEVPEAEQFIEFAKNGGDPRDYIETMYPQFDYNQVDFDEQVAGNEQAQEQLVRNQMAAEGYDQEEIDEMVEDFRNGGILEKQSKRSLNKLQTLQEKAQQELIEQNKKEAKKRREEAEKQQEKVKTIIDENKEIKGLKIPKTDKEALKNYLFEPVDDQGRSKAFIDGMNMTEEERVAVAYLKMKNFDFSTLIENEAESKNSQKLREQIKQSKEKMSGGKRKKSKKGSGSIQDIKPIF